MTRRILRFYGWIFLLAGAAFVAASSPLCALIGSVAKWLPGAGPMPGAKPSLWLGLTGSLMAVLAALAFSLSRDPEQDSAWNLILLSKGASSLLFAAFAAAERNSAFLIGTAVDGSIFLHLAWLRAGLLAKRQTNLSSRAADGRSPFYEVWFAKLNDPVTKSALWVRYTLRREAGEGEACCWYVLFDAPRGKVLRGKWARSLSELCRGQDSPFRLGESRIEPGRLVGVGEKASWDLAWNPREAPSFSFLPSILSATGLFPSGYASPASLARFSGTARVEDAALKLEGAPGSIGHIWGPRMAESWRWAHAAFDGDGSAAPQQPSEAALLRDNARSPAVFEILTTRVLLGPWRTPELTMANLWYEGRHYRNAGILSALKSVSRREGDAWTFRVDFGDVAVDGVCAPNPRLAVTLDYLSPDGRRLECRNSMAGSMRLSLSNKNGRELARLSTEDSAAVEFTTPAPRANPA